MTDTQQQTVLVITGMQSELDIAKTIPGVTAMTVGTLQNLYGPPTVGAAQPTYKAPPTYKAICRFGVSGGLSPRIKRGDLVLCYPDLISEAGVNDVAITHPILDTWCNKVFQTINRDMTKFTIAKLFSDPHVWITDPVRRAEFWKRTGAEFCDNESAIVYQYATAWNLPAIYLGAISDESDDTVINNPSELNPDGSPNILVDIHDFFHDPALIIKEGLGFGQAIDSLKNAVKILGDGLGFPS